VAPLKPRLRLANALILLVLNYSNASTSLPKAIANPDWDFLAAILAIAAGLCAFAFTSGWAVARVLRLDRPGKASLMFGLGMNNNGTGLVLASLMLADHPDVMIPILFYNLVQHLVAGLADAALGRSDPPPADPAAAVRADSAQESDRAAESPFGPGRLGVQPRP
jgi:BASS family bile acid:Na+ symporter